MKTNTIGRTDVRVTEISFGGASIGNLGREVSDADSLAVLNYAWEFGIRYFDTAPHYGRGLSESRLGHYFKSKTRNDYILSTKVGRMLTPGPKLSEADGFINPSSNAVHYDYSGDGIEASFEQSCERLGVSHIDILYVHDIGAYTHGEAENASHMQAFAATGLDRLEKLKSTGKIGAFGLGVNENQVCLDIMQLRDIDVILLAGRLTLLDRSAEDELVGHCSARGTNLVLGGIFNSGILAIGPVPGATYDYAPASTEILQRVTDLQTKAQEFDLPLATAALHFSKHHASVASTLLGTAKVSSLQRNLIALNTILPKGAEKLFL